METVTGRPKGKPNLSDEIKLGILQQKKLQIVPQHIIAQDFGVARKTVNKLSEDDHECETEDWDNEDWISEDED